MSHDHCNHPPGFMAQADQVAARFRDGVAALTQLARRYLVEDGDDQMHAAASIAQGMAITASTPQVTSLLGFAVLRIVELEDIAAAACPCTPDAPAHQHLTGGYRPNWDGLRMPHRMTREDQP